MDLKRVAIVIAIPTLFWLSACSAQTTECAFADVACSPPAWLLFSKKRVARFVFSTDTGSNSVLVLKVDPRTGTVLSNVGSFSAGTLPDVLAVDPEGKFLYCANFTADSITAYSINTMSGVLTPVQTLNLSAGSNPDGFLFFSDYLLVSNNGFSTVQVYSRNASSGILTALGSPVNVVATGQPRQGVLHPNGKLVYLALEAGTFGQARLTANPTTGSIAYDGNTALSGGATNVFDEAMTYDGRFIVVAALAGPKAFVYSVDSATGALTEVSTYTTAFNNVSHAIVAHPYLPIVYIGYNAGSSNIDAFRVSSSGVLTQFSTVTMVGGFNKGLAIDPQGGFLYTVNTSQGFALAPLNASTGVFTTGTASAVAPGGTPVHVTIASYVEYTL